MTSPAESASGDASNAAPPAVQLTKPLRELIAFVLLGANAVLLFAGLVRLLIPAEYTTFSSRAGDAFNWFAGLQASLLPVLAMLLATHLAPVAPRAKLITQVALGECVGGGLLGALTLLIWVVGRLAEAEVLDAFLGLLTRFAWLAVFAAAAFVVHRVWRTLYYTPKPKPQPGVYGQPRPGWPQQPAGQPGPQGGWPGQSASWSAPAQPGGYPVVNQPVPPFASGSSSATPYPAPSQPAPPFAAPSSVEPTQAIPRQVTEPGQTGGHPNDDSDRTQRFHRDDPNQS